MFNWVQKIPAVSLLFSKTLINNLHLSTCWQPYMQIKFCLKVDSLKCRAKLISICLLVWECQVNHFLKAKIEYFDNCLLPYFIYLSLAAGYVLMSFLPHFELKNFNYLSYIAIFTSKWKRAKTPGSLIQISIHKPIILYPVHTKT